MKTITKKDSDQKIVDVRVGKDVKIFSFVNLYGCTIGDRTKIGSFVEIQKNVSVGVACKISSHTFICEGVRIGNRVFIGHNVTFINDKYPRAADESGKLLQSTDWNMLETVVEDDVSIGSSVTIMGGVTIGKSAVIGAGAVVIKDVAAQTVVVGNPAREIGRAARKE